MVVELHICLNTCPFKLTFLFGTAHSLFLFVVDCLLFVFDFLPFSFVSDFLLFLFECGFLLFLFVCDFLLFLSVSDYLLFLFVFDSPLFLVLVPWVAFCCCSSAVHSLSLLGLCWGKKLSNGQKVGRSYLGNSFPWCCGGTQFVDCWCGLLIGFLGFINCLACL